MNIGLVTFHDFNYGSALQCYATKVYLENKNCSVHVIDKAPSKNRLIELFSMMADYASACIKSPLDTVSIFKLFFSERASSLKISAASKEFIKLFNRDYICPQSYSWGELKSPRFNEGFDCFFSGSDQIWSGVRISKADLFFLRFTNKAKRIAWAPSFGGEELAPWNLRRYKKYISEYAALSAREPNGARMIKSLTGRDAPVLPDPVVLLPAEVWRARCHAEHPFAPARNGCLLAFFLDRPNSHAIEQLEALQTQTGKPVVSFGYCHESLIKRGWEHLDGSPFDFLRAIDCAELIFTDSYHACVFASLFHTPFYAFPRNYRHDQDQSVRLTELLERIGLSDRFNSAVCAVGGVPDFSQADRYFIDMRTRAMAYLEQALPLPECSGTESLAQASHGEKRAYVAYASDEVLAARSASGGVFAVLARDCIARGGVAFGAALTEESGRIVCRHVMADNEKALWALQGSKYVKSDTQGIFPNVKQQLDSGKPVLFSGTSCQIAALNAYLKKDYANLLTCDLICHGTPPQQLLDEYVAYIERKKRCRVTGLTFRRKDLDRPGRPLMPYVMTFSCLGMDGRTFEYRETLHKSAYYRMFMANTGFRSPCYRCPYACIDKPADLTLGDCYQSGSVRYLSCVITHSPAGEAAVRNAGTLVLKEIPLAEAAASHEQLRHPGVPTPGGQRLWARYQKGGFAAVQRYINLRNALVYLPGKLKNLLR